MTIATNSGHWHGEKSHPDFSSYGGETTQETSGKRVTVVAKSYWALLTYF
jgi:hypothetical protein